MIGHYTTRALVTCRKVVRFMKQCFALMILMNDFLLFDDHKFDSSGSIVLVYYFQNLPAPLNIFVRTPFKPDFSIIMTNNNQLILGKNCKSFEPFINLSVILLGLAKNMRTFAFSWL